MKRIVLVSATLVVAAMMANPAIAERPECPGKSCDAPGQNKDDDKVKGKGRFKTALCHWEEVEVDEEPTEEIVEEGFYELINIPIHAAEKHLENHELDFNDLINWAADLDGDGFYDEATVVISCEQPEKGYVLIGEDSEVDPDDADPNVPVDQTPPEPEPEPLPEEVEEISLEAVNTLLR